MKENLKVKKIKIIIAAVGILLIFTVQTWAFEVRQDEYSYPTTINTPVQIPTHQTFIITSQPSLNDSPKSCPFPVVYFDLGSARLSSDASNKLLMDLRECCAACPLYLTGYTCSIGKENQNLKLSRYRAEAVATMLRRNGYKVASVEGKGMLYGSTPERNRKVEIKLTKSNS